MTKTTGPGGGGRGKVAPKRMSKGTWGGARPGAGRKPKPGRPSTPHRARPLHSPAHPVHVTLRSRHESLRNPNVFPTLVGAIAAQRRREKSFRIVHFSVQYDHLHLIVEAQSNKGLSSGVRGLMIRIARRVNQLISAKGRFWADRYFTRTLTTPRDVRMALRYVLCNFRKHERRTSSKLLTDPYSSAPWFDGFRESRGSPLLERAKFAIPWRSFARDLPQWIGASRASRIAAETVGLPAPISPAQTRLLLAGWRRFGLISMREAPSNADRAALKQAETQRGFRRTPAISSRSSLPRERARRLSDT